MPKAPEGLIETGINLYNEACLLHENVPDKFERVVAMSTTLELASVLATINANKLSGCPGSREAVRRHYLKYAAETFDLAYDMHLAGALKLGDD